MWCNFILQWHFNPRSLAGATLENTSVSITDTISIHAPSRERQAFTAWEALFNLFQSTLPRGSDVNNQINTQAKRYFNPRSLAGATFARCRQRGDCKDFNPRSLAGATQFFYWYCCKHGISIHAPSRERP